MIQRQLISGATFSDCEKYRYKLWRIWGKGNLVNFVMLNPSTADEVANDPTIERCLHRAKEWGYAGLIVTNLFAFRATDPEAMKEAEDPIGLSNNRALCEAAEKSAIIVCAWGSHGLFKNRHEDVLQLLQRRFRRKKRTLRMNPGGVPAHLLRLPYSLKPGPF
jgi:hypothetical protein